MTNVRSITTTPRSLKTPSGLDRSVLDTEAFNKAIALERRRAERSSKLFVLMLLDLGEVLEEHSRSSRSELILCAVSSSIRDTDVTGWHAPKVLGLIFTEIDTTARNSVVGTLLQRVQGVLYNNLTFAQYSRVTIATYVYPEEWDSEVPQRPSSPVLYPDLKRRDRQKVTFSIIKRIIDILFSALGLVLGAPLLIGIAIAVKLSSDGPILFRQQRVGQYGAPFTFLKFRSMYTNNDSSIHRRYVEALIQGKSVGTEGSAPTFKLTADSRITRVGGFLRKSSLDELPQLLNVLRGEMSLVGPRPAIPYEVKAYEPWHRRRVLEAKPGITGLWQVKGRSRVTFDDMVRLDVRYATAQSLWLDLEILTETPRAVFSGLGAC